MDDVQKIADKYEVPPEFFDALWDVYIAGNKRGFITGAISVHNEAAKL